MVAPSNEAEEQFRKIFIGGLAINTTEDSLKEYLSSYGTIEDIVVMKDPATKRSRGFGFVTFDCMASVDKAMAARPHTIDDKTVDMKRAVPRDKSSNPESNLSVTKLYVSGVKPDHSEDSFREYFSKFGNVLEVDVIMDKNTNKPRGFAFVSFDDFDPVDKCCLYKSHHVAGHRCDVKKALSKEEMAKMEQVRREREWRGLVPPGPPVPGDHRRFAGPFGAPAFPPYWPGGAYDGYGGYGHQGGDAYNASYQGYAGGYGAPSPGYGGGQGPHAGSYAGGQGWAHGGPPSGGPWGSGWAQGGPGRGGGGNWGGGYGGGRY